MPKRKCLFNNKLQTKCPYFKAGRNENEAECTICKTFGSVANKGSYDLKAYINAAKHKKQIQSCHNTPRSLNFLLNKIQKQNW
jgi:hypothetical protein